MSHKRETILKATSCSFMGGAVASLACTALYEAIDKIGAAEYSVISIVCEWMGALFFIATCFCLVRLASDLDEIECKARLFSNDKSKSIIEIWKRAVRAVAEDNIRYSDSQNTIDDEKILNGEIKIRRRIKILQLSFLLFFAGGIVFLVCSKVFK